MTPNINTGISTMFVSSHKRDTGSLFDCYSKRIRKLIGMTITSHDTNSEIDTEFAVQTSYIKDSDIIANIDRIISEI